MPLVPNIGPRGIRRRQVIGLAWMGVAIAAGAALLAAGVSPWWRLTVALPLLMAGVGVFQAKEKT